jgi:ComF family protein
MGAAEKVEGRARRARWVLLGILFPGRCLLCGHWLPFDAAKGDAEVAGGADVPVCAACRQSLVLIHGARCARCGMPLVSEIGTCARCKGAGYAFESNIALFPYSGAPKELIARLKFDGRSRCAAIFADLAAAALEGPRSAIPVVPVPPRPGRSGPDAVELVARCLARDHGSNVQRLLKRTGGAQQKSLDFAQRRGNLAGMLQIVSGSPATVPSRVVLLDDVFTTGATLDACARTLLEAGCQRVLGLTLAIEE